METEGHTCLVGAGVEVQATPNDAQTSTRSPGSIAAAPRLERDSSLFISLATLPPSGHKV